MSAVQTLIIQNSFYHLSCLVVRHGLVPSRKSALRVFVHDVLRSVPDIQVMYMNSLCGMLRKNEFSGLWKSSDFLWFMTCRIKIMYTGFWLRSLRGKRPAETEGEFRIMGSVLCR